MVCMLGEGVGGKKNEGRKNSISQHLLLIYFNIENMVYSEIQAPEI